MNVMYLYQQAKRQMTELDALVREVHRISKGEHQRRALSDQFVNKFLIDQTVYALLL